MLQLQIDQENCIQCGECAEDCPNDVISLDAGYPVVIADREERCIACQHCFAVCPTGALSIFGLDPQDSSSLDNALPSPQQLATLMKGRRSVRQYLDEPVATSTIAELIDVVANGPTGVNNRQLLFTVVENQRAMTTLRKDTVEGIRKVVEQDGLPEGLEFFSGIVEAADAGKDILFRNAPHLLIVSSPADGPSPEQDCLIALTYFELLAATSGLGTVWNGLCRWALTKIVPELLGQLKIPEDHAIGYMMSFGKPAVEYHRTVQRGGANINKV
jgi:nitroreductase/NAD-dependent dihydropyrimidine dehydrogenase PreA subunit